MMNSCKDIYIKTENSYTKREIKIAKKQVEIESYMLHNRMLYGQEKEIIKYNTSRNKTNWTYIKSAQN